MRTKRFLACDPRLTECLRGRLWVVASVGWRSMPRAGRLRRSVRSFFVGLHTCGCITCSICHLPVPLLPVLALLCKSLITAQVPEAPASKKNHNNINNKHHPSSNFLSKMMLSRRLSSSGGICATMSSAHCAEDEQAGHHIPRWRHMDANQRKAARHTADQNQRQQHPFVAFLFSCGQDRPATTTTKPTRIPLALVAMNRASKKIAVWDSLGWGCRSLKGDREQKFQS